MGIERANRKNTWLSISISGLCIQVALLDHMHRNSPCVIAYAAAELVCVTKGEGNGCSVLVEDKDGYHTQSSGHQNVAGGSQAKHRQDGVSAGGWHLLVLRNLAHMLHI